MWCRSESCRHFTASVCASAGRSELRSDDVPLPLGGSVLAVGLSVLIASIAFFYRKTHWADNCPRCPKGVKQLHSSCSTNVCIKNLIFSFPGLVPSVFLKARPHRFFSSESSGKETLFTDSAETHQSSIQGSPNTVYSWTFDSWVYVAKNTLYLVLPCDKHPVITQPESSAP